MQNLLNFKSFFKFLSRNKTYTAIELFGLSVSLMFVILIAAYCIQEFSTDRHHADVDRIYLLGDENYLLSSYGIPERIKAHFPEVEETSTVAPGYILNLAEAMPVSNDGKIVNGSIQFVNENFFRFFSFPLLSGDKEHVLPDRNQAVISQTFARKLFEGEDPIGKSIRLNDSVSVTVSGIMQDIHHSYIRYCDLAVRIENLRFFRSDLDGNSFGDALNCLAFVKARPGADLQARSEDMRDFLKTFFWYFEKDLAGQVVLLPFTDAYFSDYYSGEAMEFARQMCANGDKRLVLILVSVGLLILLFAVINYINLTVAQTGFRAKEMAIRRLLGSSRFDLFNRLMMESSCLTFVSFLIGLLLAFAYVPYANELLQTSLGLESMATPVNLAAILLLIAVISFISGLLPAILISRTKPVDVVKGAFRQKTKMVFSRFFITFQNTITIAMIAAAIIMIAQVNYMVKAPLGYTKENIIDIPVSNLGNDEQARTLMKELSGLASVSRISASEGTPYSGGNNNTLQIGGRNIGFQEIRCDSVFISMLGLEVIRENHVASSRARYVNEMVLKEENLPLDATTFQFYDETPIAGVIKDFRLTNILRAQAPIIVWVRKAAHIFPENILVEVQGEPYEAFRSVKETYERFTRLEFPGKFIDEQIQASFAAQERTIRIVTVFTFVAILLSFLGLLAMSTYFIQQRSREIGLRKVFGSATWEVLVRLIYTFLNYVLVAFVIATPVVWYIMRDWLSGYSYRISLSPGFFLLAGFSCFVISFLTVYWQSYQAATANPVNSIKSE